MPQAKQVHNHSPSPLTSVPTSDSDILDSDASDSSESGLECSTNSDSRTIPKLPGEAGQPGHGGYTLEDALDWNPNTFKKLKVWQLQIT